MEEVLEKMEALGSLKPKETISSFEGLYKNWGKLDNQEERRKELLEIQKSNRNAKLDLFRGILDLVNTVEQHDIFKYNKKVHYRPSIYVAGFNKASPAYKDILMLSEWLIEKPSDFAENWFITPCPKGTRVLLVATNGKTKCYTKYGQFKFQIPSALPGGNGDSPRSKSTCCVLDCFYYEQKNTLYVLDLLAWNNQPMTDCDTEFRHYWLQTQFAENPDIGIISKKNKIKFVLLPKSPCTPDELNKFMMTYPHFEDNTPNLDGILFYHKQAHYISGETPLVGWLFPYMVPEVLGADISVQSIYTLQKPVGYVNQAEFIKKFEEKIGKKKSNRRSPANSNDMDTAVVNKTQMETKGSKRKSADTASAETSLSMDAEDSTKENGTFIEKLIESTAVHKTEMEAEESTSKSVDTVGADSSVTMEDITNEEMIEKLVDSIVTESTSSMESDGYTKAREQSAKDKK